jgi:hypothetical protein
MIHHERVVPPQHVYPPDEWSIVEKQYSPEFLEMTETIFAVGNGYLGMRGCFEEGTPVCNNGTYVNGFYDTWPIVYGEDAFGFARTGQTIVNVTDAKTIKLYVDDEPFYLPRDRMGNAGGQAGPNPVEAPRLLPAPASRGDPLSRRNAECGGAPRPVLRDGDAPAARR